MRAYKANMIPGGTTPVINVSQYDNDYAVTVTLIEGAEIYTPPAGATIRVEGTKPDGHGFEYPCTYQGNVVTMPIYTQMTVVSGRFPIELVVYQSGLRVGSCNIIFAVEKAPLGENTDISETVIPDIIVGAQAQADAAAASATAAASSAASAETAKTAAMDAAQDAIDAAQELQTAIQFNAALIHDTASGAVASFSDGADNIPMQSVVAEITPVQSGSGDPSPTNIRPISGRTGMTVKRCGRNLMPKSTVNTTSRGITATANADGSVHVTGTATEDTVISMLLNFNLPAGSFIWSSGLNESFSTYDTYLSSGGTIARGNANSPGPSFTLTEARKVTANVRVRSGQTVNITVYPMVRPASITDDTYEPYTATEIPITWESIAGTVYGGTLDVVSGVLTVDRKLVQFNSLTWTADTTGGRYYIAATPADALNVGTASATTEGLAIASNIHNVGVKGIAYMDDDGSLSQYNQAFRIYDASCTTLAAYMEKYGTGQLCYYLATPQTYQLTGAEVRTLLGGNTIYTDAGDVSVEYIADTKLYIDNKIAELQALVLENN